MPESLGSISAHWFWLTLAAILGAAEMLAPGFFLIWLALAIFSADALSRAYRRRTGNLLPS